MPPNWTDEELRAAIEAYLEMMRCERAGTPYVQKDMYHIGEKVPWKDC